MNTTDSKAVLQLPEDSTVVQVSEIIPLPTFLVSLFMNKGHPWAAVVPFNHLWMTFSKQHLSKSKNTQYIFNFLLAATGSEDDDDEKDKTSQLAINMEEINPVMMQWASTHFSSVEKIASQHDKRIEKEKMQEASNIIVQ